MKKFSHIRLIALMGLLAAGCGTKASATKIEMDRVDRSLVGGNQGYLIGAPPSTDLEAGTREMMELEVVLPAQAGRRRSHTITESAPIPSMTGSVVESDESAGQPKHKKTYYKK